MGDVELNMHCQLKRASSVAINGSCYALHGQPCRNVLLVFNPPKLLSLPMVTMDAADTHVARPTVPLFPPCLVHDQKPCCMR